MMNVRVSIRTLRAVALGLCLAAALCLRHAPRAYAASDCEGDACSQVTVTFDDAKQQYQAQNNSSDRWVRLEAANLAGSSWVCVGPAKSEYLNIKSIAGAYHAAFAAERCGARGMQ